MSGSQRCSACYEVFVPFILEHLRADEDMQKYLNYLNEKSISLSGDASKRGLAVHGHAYCQCSTPADGEIKRKFIYICTDCNIQKLWNHLTGTANKKVNDTELYRFAVHRSSWRIRAAIKTGQKVKSQSTESDVHGGTANLPQLSFNQQQEHIIQNCSPDVSPLQLPTTPQALNLSPGAQIASDLFVDAALSFFMRTEPYETFEE